MPLTRIMPDIIALILIYQLVYYKRWKNDQLILKTILYLYFCGVILVTLMPVIVNLPQVISNTYVSMNMIPFSDVIMQQGDYVRQIVLNVIMLVPFGILYPLIYNKSFKNVVFKGFLISLSIELIQPLLGSGRSSDITDIITNVTGTIIGFIIYKAFKTTFIGFKQLIGK